MNAVPNVGDAPKKKQAKKKWSKKMMVDKIRG